VPITYAPGSVMQQTGGVDSEMHSIRTVALGSLTGSPQT